MKRDATLAQRAIVAMALTIGFYTLGLVLGLGTIILPFAIAYFTGHFIIKLMIVCFISGGAILAAMIPRKDKFVPPGPILVPEEHPGLFKAIREVAEKAQQEMPRRVYLIPEFNAWVMQTGSTGGYGGDRMMGIGLPLLSAMNSSQFKAIIAHEFGHYHHGDTRLGPRIYRTRAAIERTFIELRDRESILRFPFKWYGLKFLKITHAISRNQEYNADKLAAQIAGKNAMISALEELDRKAFAYQSYLQQEFLPLLSAGKLPPVIEGFKLFLKSEYYRKKILEFMRNTVRDENPDIYDTHPATADRIAALGVYRVADVETDFSPAINLVCDQCELEKALVRSMVNGIKYTELQQVNWSDDFSEVYISAWKKTVGQNYRKFGKITPKDFSDFIGDPIKFLSASGKRTKIPQGALLHFLGILKNTVSSALALLLMKRGCQVKTELGEEIVMMKDDIAIKPFSVISRLATGELAEEDWLNICSTFGISEVDLFHPLDHVLHE